MTTEVIISLAVFLAIGLVFVLAFAIGAPRARAEQKRRQRMFTFYSANDAELDPAKKTVYALDYRLKDKRPFVVVVPGGGYEIVCHKGEGEPIAEQINKLGYSAFVLNYRTSALAHCPAPQDDIGNLVRYIQDHAEELNVNSSDYAVVGFSAGGHLAASLATKNIGYTNYGITAPKAVLLAYPVITMKEDSNHESRNNLIGIDPPTQLVSKYSIEENVDETYPPVFMWRRADDSCVPGAGADRFKEALDASGVKNIYEVYPGNRHGGGLAVGAEMEGWLSRAIAFWRANN